MIDNEVLRMDSGLISFNYRSSAIIVKLINSTNVILTGLINVSLLRDSITILVNIMDVWALNEVILCCFRFSLFFGMLRYVIWFSAHVF